MKSMRFLGVVAIGVAACARSVATREVPTPSVVETPLFSFHSNFWVNLHHFLYMTARARAGLDANRAAVGLVLGDTVGFGTLTGDQQDGWAAALAHYDRAVARRDILFDSSLVAVNDRLAELEAATAVTGAPGLDAGIATALDRAASAYRVLWWPRHDAANRRWMSDALVPLREHGAEAARVEAVAFRTRWSAAPVRVDVSAYTNWAGAYTTEHPSHVNIGSVDQIGGGGPSSFETLFHEVLHTMDDSLFTVVRASFRESGKRLPRDATHPFIFFTAGEVTRRLFPGYVPFAESGGLWTRNPDFARMLPLLREHWQPYLDSRVTLEVALRGIAEGW